MTTVRSQSRRLVAPGVAILLGVAFIAATLTLGASFRNGVVKSMAGTIGDASVVVGRDYSVENAKVISPAMADDVRKLAGVTGVRAVAQGSATLDNGDNGSFMFLQNVPPTSKDTKLTQGRLPKASGEVLVNESAAELLELKVGDKVTIKLQRVIDNTKDESKIDVSIVGVLDAGYDVTPYPTQPQLFAIDSDALSWTQGGYEYLYVYGDGSQQDLAAKVKAVPSISDAKLIVKTADDEARQRIDNTSSGADAMQGFLLAFGILALFVGALVVANTFSILVAQRTRQFALLRCIGATTRQVFGMVVREGLLLSAVAGAAGVVVGVGLTATAIPLLGDLLPVDGLALDWTSVVIPLAAGILVTLLAAIAPARGATRVAPVAALRPQLTPLTKRRAGKVQIVIGVVLLVAGIALLVVGAMQKENGVYIALPGGLVSAVGMLMLGGVWVPGLIGLLGRLVRRAGVPAELAVDNARRNPSRAASTASALLIGVTLVTMMTVGAASATATTTRELNNFFAADAAVYATDSLSDETLAKLRGVQGVAGLATFYMGNITISRDNQGIGLAAYGESKESATVVRSTRALDLLAPDVIVVPEQFALGGNAILDGDQLQVSSDNSDVQMTLKAKVLPGQGNFVVTKENMLKLDPKALRGAWLRVADDADAAKTITRVNNALSDVQGAMADGPAVQRQQVQQSIDAALLVVVGLLAVSVLISLVGVGNTLGLAVLERTQEVGLLRALGLTRRQTRSMIGIEALMLGFAAVVVGLVFGTGYAIAGTKALLGDTSSLTIVVPWLRLVLITAIGLGAAWLASVVPSNRAARISPQEALATE